MVLGIQIVGVLFALAMLYLSFVQFKKKNFSSHEFIFWAILWVIIAITSMMPESLQKVTSALDVSRPFDLIVLLGFVLLTLLTFLNYLQNKKNQRKVEELVRRIALK